MAVVHDSGFSVETQISCDSDMSSHYTYHSFIVVPTTQLTILLDQ